MNKTTILWIISLPLILLFLYTAVIKFIDYDIFKEELLMSPILRPIAGVITWALPISEIITALLLIFTSTRLIGLYIALGLIIAFTVYLIMLNDTDSRLPCSCGGVIEMFSWKQHLLLNTLLILLECTGIWLQKKIKSEEQKA